MEQSALSLPMKPIKAPISPGDFHFVVSDFESQSLSEMKIFASDGKLLHTLKCLAKGQVADYRIPKGDTPPGLYRLGAFYETRSNEPWHIWRSFGKYFIDMEERQNQEAQWGRSGVGVHGGGSGLPDPLAPYQKLVPTHGCIRVHNADMENIIVPLYRQAEASGNTVWLTVYQH